jgi:hypothetical protein
MGKRCASAVEPPSTGQFSFTGSQHQELPTLTPAVVRTIPDFHRGGVPSGHGYLILTMFAWLGV